MSKISSDDITQIVYTVDSGVVGVFAIGVVLDDEQSNFESVHEDVNRHITGINEFIAEKYGVEDAVNADNMHLDHILVKDKISSKSTASSAYDIKNIKYVKKCENLNSAIDIDSVRKSSGNNTSTQAINAFTYDEYYHNFVYRGGNNYVYLYRKSTNTEAICTTSPTFPHLGDGNKRLDCGAKWMPTIVQAKFQSEITSGKNRTTLIFAYESGYNNYNNLIKDDNETLEMEVAFYNYIHANEEYKLGSAFQLLTGKTFSTNIPDYYLDTELCDDPNVLTFCVGCHDARKLSTNVFYYWAIDSKNGSQTPAYQQNGRFRVVAQRGYHIAETVSTYNVFSEEHEHSILLGFGSEYNWVPNPRNAWNLAASGEKWEYHEGDIYCY
ncbi:MAG: hypothetical protein Q4C64_05895 [Erysipelotrichia bacterium]|nr:hypothetical protein [Erysipelotrichia bacterium]